MKGTHYDTLGIQASATADEIRRAYRLLAQKWHPDKNVGNHEEAERRFKSINFAYSILFDINKRSEYDRLLQNAKSSYGSTDSSDSRYANTGAREKKHDTEKDASNSQNNAQSASNRENDDFNPYEIFFREMNSAALSRARAGYSESRIEDSLIKDGCPDEMAALLAKAAYQSSTKARRNGRIPDNEPTLSNRASLFEKIDHETNPIKIFGLSLVVCFAIYLVFS